MMNSISNFLTFIVENWVMIATFILLIIGCIKYIKVWMSKTNEEKIEIVKNQIKECIMYYVNQAEIDFEDIKNAGLIKRSQVIKKIFDRYPILDKVVNQEDLINWIDDMIDEALVELRKIIEKNKQTSKRN